ncbi:MAG TPA: FtsX-like permease family protein, partial [Bryobacteraceae bacterium]|nr:FtsX-like permease family protein [Bryobacteraceae bacterium]
GGDPKALGSTIRVDGNKLMIIGVAPPGFDYPGKAVLWKPAAFSRGNNGWEVIARLKPGVTWPQARQAFAAEADRLWPNRTAVQKIQFPSRITALRDQLAGPARNASLVLMACVVLILLIACTNVANLLMARTADRAVELSIRSALGASQARLSRQLLTECVLLALAASLAGILVAFWTTSIAAKVQPAPIASQAYSILDGRVLCFAIAISILSGLLFGVLPSLYAGRVHRFALRGSSDTRGSRLVREALVAAQVVLTVILLASSLSVGRAFVHLMQIDRGFVPKGLVTVNVSLEGTTHQANGRSRVYFEEALARVRRLPGVRSASATEFLPLYAAGFIGGVFAVDGRPGRASATIVPVFSDYFRTMGGHIVAGREFTAAEVRQNANVCMVSERFAAEFGSAADALGHQVFREPRKIIGVVKGMDYAKHDLIDANPRLVFLPSSRPGGFFSTFVARVDGRAEGQLARIRDAIQSVDPEVPVFGTKTMEQRLDDVLARPQFYRTAVLCFAAFAVLLAVIGIYGIVSYAVAQRTREMGVRMALGTTPAKLRAGLLRQGLLTVGAGVIPGIAGAFFAGRLLG